MFALILAAAFALPPQQSDAVIGVTAIHVESGRRISVRGTERFPMGSVYKFPIALTVLKRVDSGTIRLDREVTIQPKDFAPGWSPLRDEANGKPITLTVRELLRNAVEISDNTASDALLRMVGTHAVTTRMAELGFAAIRIDRSEAEMARDLGAPGGMERYAIDVRDTTSPDAMAGLLLAFFHGKDGLSKSSHELLVQWMIDTPTGSRRIRAGMPKGAIVMHKTGTMPGTTNDAGVVTVGDEHVVVVIFTKASKRDKTADAESDIAAIAAKVWAELAKSHHSSR
jgi:beta-lactamase class A